MARRNDGLPRSDKRELTDDELRQVRSLSSIGTPMVEIAAMLDISVRTLERRMHDQPAVGVAIKKGRAMANGKVAQSLFDMATNDKNVSAAIFWLKARAGWSEKDHESEPSKEIVVKFDRDKKAEDKDEDD